MRGNCRNAFRSLSQNLPRLREPLTHSMPEERDAVYANRRRIQGERGKNLLRRRGLMLERPFAHCYETGRMRRVHLRGRENILKLKRLLIHVAGFNLTLVLR